MDIDYNFSTLPDEIKLHIFSYLSHEELSSSVAKTCCEWEQLAFDAHLWKVVAFNENDDEKDITNILTNSYLAQRVTFSNMRFSLRWFDFPKCVLKHVKELIFKSCRFGVMDVNRLPDIFPNVEKITFERTPGHFYFEPKVSQWHLLKEVKLSHLSKEHANTNILLLATFCKNLETLIAENCNGVTDSNFLTFANQFKHSLKRLEISFNDMSNISYNALSKCEFLQILNVFDARNMTDQDLYTLRNLKLLDTLIINNGKNLFSAQFSHLFYRVEFQRLRALLLNFCPKLNDATFNTLIRCCPLLTKIGLLTAGEITGNIATTLYYCKHLKELVLYGVPKVTDVTQIKLLLPRIIHSTFRGRFEVTKYLKRSVRNVLTFNQC